MFVKLIVSFVAIAAGSTVFPDTRAPIQRLRYISEKLAVLLPANPACNAEPVQAMDRRSIIDSIVQFVQNEESELDSFVSVLSRAHRCGLTAADIDSYKWDVIEALMAVRVAETTTTTTAAPTNPLKRREESSLESRMFIEDALIPRKKSRPTTTLTVVVDESNDEVIEVMPETTAQPAMTGNLSPDSTSRLISRLKFYMDQFPESEVHDPYWSYLRNLQAHRAQHGDYAAIRTDLNLLVDMYATSKNIAKVFKAAFLIITKGESLPHRLLALPDHLVRASARPLKARLEEYYDRPSFRWTKDNYTELSKWLAAQVKQGHIDKVHDALNLALLGLIRKSTIADTFYQAYKALGGQY